MKKFILDKCMNVIKDNIEEFSENGRNGCPYSIPSAHSYNTIIDEDHRVSSRLVVDNKHVTDTSSEGFYAYIFREYAEKLHPKPIYMKIEFNYILQEMTTKYIEFIMYNKSTDEQLEQARVNFLDKEGFEKWKNV